MPQSVALSGDTEPAAQPEPAAALQLPLQAAEVKPELFPNTPAGHRLHADAPGKEYVPAGHAIGLIDDRGQREPAGQRTGAPEEQ